MIKLIATDMDGTFLDSNKNFDREFVDIFFKMKEKGIKFVIASGNQYYRLYQKFVPISNDLYFISENGSYIAHGTKMLSSNTMTRENVDKVLDALKDMNDVFIILCGIKSAYLLEKNKDRLDIVTTYYCNYKIVDSFDNIDDDIMKIAIYREGGNQVFFDKLQAVVPENIKLVTSGNEWTDVQNRSINKGVGMELLQEMLNISKDECMAFGDQMNDYELLKSVKYSYAMENATDKIKEIAYAIAPSNDEQGVLQIIKDVLKRDEY